MVVTRQAIRNGRGPALLTLLGNETALLLWGLAAAFGVTALVAASRITYDGFRLVGAAVLTAIGIQSLIRTRRESSPQLETPADASPRRRGGWRAYSVGVVTNLANPKAGIFAMSFLPQFASRSGPTVATLSLLAALWAAVDAVWFVGVIWFIGRAKAFFSRPGVWLRLTQISGAVLIGMGVRLAVAG